MDYDAVLAQVLALLQQEQRLSYRVLKRRLHLDDDLLEDLKEDLIYAKQLAVDEDGRVLVWIGGTSRAPSTAASVPLPATPGVSPASGVASPVIPPTPDAERRQLTVLFCDLVDSTRLATQLDPEDYREVVRAYQTACGEVIQRYSGHIAQYLGDGLLVYFGYPQAHEDEAQRAVRTGLEMVEALQALQSHLDAQYGVRLAIRIGIHTGVVVVGEIGGRGRQEQLALGDTPNIAARLQGLATPNTVVISAATSRLVEGFFTCQALGAQEIKGVSQPLLVYRVLHASAAQTRLDVATPRGLTPLVGRDEEVALMQRRWAQATTGMGQVVLISGEAGIGKSRLIEVLRERVGREGATWLTFRCSPYHTHSALYPVITHLHRVLQLRPEETPAAQLDRLERAVQGTHLPLEEVVPLLASLLSVPLAGRYASLDWSPQKQRQKTHEALVAWLMTEAERQPVLAVWEDLHWADPSTLEWLGLVLDQTPTAPLCTLLTYRPEFPPPWAPRSYLTQLTLSRLTRAQVEEMLQRLMGGKRLPTEVVQQMVAKTDGVPLFVEELAKVVLEAGGLQEREDHYELTGSLPALAIPATLQDALRARLDRLSDGKAVAQLGAVLGRMFAYELLRAVSPLDELVLWRGLGQLVQAEVLYQRGVPPQATYTFKHALLQEAAYQSLLRSTRQQYHQRTAQVVAERFPELAETQPELLAQHYTEAGLAEEAVRYWQRAGERSSVRSDYVEAVTHFTQGLEVLKTLPDTPTRAQRELTLQLTLAGALRATKGFAAREVGDAFARAQALCQQVEDTPQLCDILVGLSSFYVNRGEYQTARELTEQALTLAQRLHDLGRRIRAHAQLGNVLYWLGELVAARAHLEQALTLPGFQPDRALPFSGQDPRVLALAYEALTLWRLGYPSQALTRSQEMLTLTQGAQHVFSLARALQYAMLLHQLRREVRATQERAEAALALSTEQGFVQWWGVVTLQRGWVLVAQGQPEEGLTQMHQGLAARLATGSGAGQSAFRAQLAEVYGGIGQAEAGLPLLAEALAWVDTTGERHYAPEVYRIKGELLLCQAIPDTPQAEACFQQALAVARHQQAKSWELRTAMSLCRLWQRQGKRAEAYELLAPIYGWFTEGFDTADLQEAKALLDALA